jgi:protein-S-isoprenylcysteine O-methyltransferase Ste14
VASWSWSRIATRMRVPLGFAFAVAYFWFAVPSWASITLGAMLSLIGLAVRAIASGHIRKNAELATTGPYAYTRNPLYLGSVLMAVGFVIAARNGWIALGATIMFLVIYVPVIKAEEVYLRGIFTGYEQYAANVPRLLPRLTAYRGANAAGNDSHGGLGSFSRELYLKHREYNAALGSGLMLGALILKMLVGAH